MLPMSRIGFMNGIGREIFLRYLLLSSRGSNERRESDNIHTKNIKNYKKKKNRIHRVNKENCNIINTDVVETIKSATNEIK